jgi:hypothetical protein
MRAQLVQAWREGSVYWISDVFRRLMAFAEESQNLTASIKTANELTWQVINKVFGWTPDDHSNSRVFRDVLGGDLCPWPKIIARHNKEFWDGFDKLLGELRNDARSRTTEVGDQIPRTKQTLEPENKFVKDGTTWEIVYAGETCKVGASILGFEYIAVLLQHPGVPMTPLELQGLAGGVSLSQSYTEVAELSIQEGAGDDEPSDDSGTVGRDDRVDVTYAVQAERQGEARQEEIEKRLATLGDLHSPEAADLQKEYDDIESHFACSRNIRGQPRPINDPNENARSSITKALGRAYMKIEEQSSSTAAHLRDSIETGSKFKYRDQSVHWRVSRTAQAHKPSVRQSPT